MKVEFLDNNPEKFGNIHIGDLMNSKPTRFTFDTTVKLRNNFILKEVSND